MHRKVLHKTEMAIFLYRFPEKQMKFFSMFLIFFEPFFVRKVMKENQIRKVWKSEEGNVKNIGKKLSTQLPGF